MSYMLPSHIRRYFGGYIQSLLRSVGEQQLDESYFLQCLFHPEDLEQRLERIETVAQTQATLLEVGRIGSPVDLDNRLVDAWTELRVIDQIQKENFTGITKIREIADLGASREGRNYAFQVKHIRTSLIEHIERLNAQSEHEPEVIRLRRTSNPFGTFEAIQFNFVEPLRNLFWDSIISKNGRFRSWQGDHIRCLAIVTNDSSLGMSSYTCRYKVT